MTVSDVFDLLFVDDNTRFIICDSDSCVLLLGHCFDDDVISYCHYEVFSFTYKPGFNRVYVVVDLEGLE